MSQKKDTPKLMHDANASQDVKVQYLIKVEGWEGYGRYWNACEQIRSARNCRLDTEQPGFWEILSELWKIKVEELKVYTSRLVWVYRLLSTDSEEKDTVGRYLWSDRIDRDVAEYRQRREGKSLGGQITAAMRYAPNLEEVKCSSATPILQPSEGSAIASFYLSLLSDRSNLSDRKKFEDLRVAHGVTPEQCERLRALGREFSRECIAHYVRLTSLHLRGKGELKMDFLAYMEAWLLRDAKERRGWFKDNNFKIQERPTRERIPANVAVLVKKAGG
jgi:hypothetical protein